MTKPLSDRLTASRECDAEIAAALGYFHHKFTTSLIHAVSLFKDQRDMPDRIPSDPLECCRAALKQRGL